MSLLHELTDAVHNLIVVDDNIRELKFLKLNATLQKVVQQAVDSAHGVHFSHVVDLKLS